MSDEIVLNGYGSVLTMLDKPERSSGNEGPSENAYASATGRASPRRATAPAGSDMNDDIPFAPEFR